MEKIKTHIRKAQIKKATLELIHEKGPKALTISLIAKRVGVTNSNLYRHFSGKEDILAVIISEISTALEIIVKEARENKFPLDALKAIYFGHLKYFENNKNYPRIIFSENLYSANKELLNKLRCNTLNYLNAITGILNEASKKHLLRKGINTEAAAILFIGQIQFVTLQWMLSRNSFPLRDRAERLWPFYLRSILFDQKREGL